MSLLNNNYMNIGLFVGSMSSNYHEGIVSGAYNALQKLNYKLWSALLNSLNFFYWW